VILRNKDITPEDEDDDAPMYYHILKLANDIFSQQVIVVNRPKLSVLNTSQSPVLLIRKIPTVLLGHSLGAPNFFPKNYGSTNLCCNTIAICFVIWKTNVG